jgi:transcriptional regulator with XRE-family HTH domain
VRTPPCGHAEDGHVTPRTRTLAASIRTVRTDARFGVREPARRIGVSPQMLSQWKRGVRRPRVEDVSAILGAVSVVEWSPLSIPGPLQTPSYPRATFAAYGLSREEADRRMAIRLERPHLITGRFTFEALVGEAALRDRIGARPRCSTSCRVAVAWRAFLSHLVRAPQGLA